MGTFLDFSEYDPTNMQNGSKCRVPGKAVLMVTSVIHKEGNKGPYFGVSFDVIAHEKPEAVGQEYFQIFPLGGKGSQGTLKLAKALGLVTDEQIQAAVLGSKGGFSLDLREGSNAKVCCGVITVGEYNGKPSDKIWDFFPLNHPAVADYPQPSAASPQTQAAQPDVSVPLVETPATQPALEDGDDLPF